MRHIAHSNSSSMETNTSFTFKRSWLEVVRELSDPMEQAVLLMAIATYGIERRFVPTSSPAVNAIMRVIMADIDSRGSRRTPVQESEIPGKVKAELEMTKELMRDEQDFYREDASCDIELLKQGVRGYIERFGHECVARGRFHASQSDFNADFRRWFTPGICDDPSASSRYFRQRLPAH